MYRISRILGSMNRLRRREKSRPFSLDIADFAGIVIFLILAIGAGEFAMFWNARAERPMTAGPAPSEVTASIRPPASIPAGPAVQGRSRPVSPPARLPAPSLAKTGDTEASRKKKPGLDLLARVRPGVDSSSEPAVPKSIKRVTPLKSGPPSDANPVKGPPARLSRPAKHPARAPNMARQPKRESRDVKTPAHQAPKTKPRISTPRVVKSPVPPAPALDRPTPWPVEEKLPVPVFAKRERRKRGTEVARLYAPPAPVFPQPTPWPEAVKRTGLVYAKSTRWEREPPAARLRAAGLRGDGPSLARPNGDIPVMRKMRQRVSRMTKSRKTPASVRRRDRGLASLSRPDAVRPMGAPRRGLIDGYQSTIPSSAETRLLARSVWETFNVRHIQIGEEVIQWDPKRDELKIKPASEIWKRRRGRRDIKRSRNKRGRLRRADRTMAILKGEIRGSLYQSVVRAGGNGALAIALANVFSWKVDFSSDLQPGDVFSIAAEQWISASNGRRRWGRVFAAKLETGSKVHRAIGFPGENGRLQYYDQEGKPLHNLFFRLPVNYTRISSGYSRRRFHPILKIHRPHTGIDYAAPYGTPVRAAADGVVVTARWSGQGGKTIELKHRERWTTRYHHLSRYARGVRRGKRVTRGDIIGYVGSTGMSTGPHLDFRVRRDGKLMNPLRLKRVSGAPVSIPDRKRFLRVWNLLFAHLDERVRKVESQPGANLAAAQSVGR